MTNAPKTRLAQIAAATLAAGILLPVVAGAVVLPQAGPIPAPRPAILVDAGLQTKPLAVVHRNMIQISSEIQDMPEERRTVRVVGINFLPDAGEDIDFSTSSEQTAAVGYAEWFVMTAITRMFETDDAEELQVASN